MDGKNLSGSFKRLASHSKVNIKTKDINGCDKENSDIGREIYAQHGLPLALKQAIAYIKKQKNIDQKFGVKDYLEEYKRLIKQQRVY